jgi:hypothetical protein
MANAPRKVRQWRRRKESKTWQIVGRPSFRYVGAGWKKQQSAGAVSCMGMASGTDGLLSTEVGIGAAFAPMLIA